MKLNLIFCRNHYCLAAEETCSSGLHSQPAATHTPVELLAMKGLTSKNRKVLIDSHPGTPINVTQLWPGLTIEPIHCHHRLVGEIVNVILIGSPASSRGGDLVCSAALVLPRPEPCHICVMR